MASDNCRPALLQQNGTTVMYVVRRR